MFAQRKALENSEKSLSEFIPYSAVIAPGVVICREGDLVATVKISGKVFEAVSNEALQRDAERQNNFLKVMASASSTDEMSLKVHRIRRVVHDELSVPDENSSSRFVRDFVRAYNREISENNLMATELYVSLVSHKATLLKRDKYKESEIREELNERLDVFGKVFDQLVSSLRDYEPAVLGEYEDENGVVFSHQLSFYNFLLTGQWQKVRVPFMPLNEALGNVQVFGGADTLEFQTALGKSYVQSIELKDYPMATYSRLLDGLLYNTNFDQSSYPFIETQTFTALSKNKGLKALKLQQNQLRSAEDDAVSQMHYLTVARDMVANGQIVIGDYSYSLLVFGSEDTVVANANDSVKKLPSDQPYYFNFHYTDPEKDSLGDVPLGNTAILGASGAGKTVLLNFLLCSAQKYRDKDHQLSVILFDKDKGAELAIKAMGGGYLAIENGKPSGINPFQLEPTTENIQFLIGWTKRLIGRDGLQITPLDEQRIATAVETVMSMPAKYRRLAVLPQSLQTGDRVEDAQNSLTMRLSKWIETGPLAWAFDNEINTLDLNEFPNFGIDGTDFLENEDVRGPITEILLYLIETQVMKDKRRTIIVMDEFWKYLSDPATAQFAFDKLKTIRKQNGIFVFASQSPEDVLKSERGSAFVDNTATKIYLPNPYANEKDYTEGFKCTKDEFSIIKSLDTQSRLMLIKQGPVSVMIRLDLGNFKRALKIFSGTAGTTKFGEKLFSLVGDDPEVWIPYFFGDKPLPTQPREEV